MFTRPFAGYTYSYPHKSAYRALDPMPLSQVWEDENLDALFLYLHIPFCEFRCGFCNLFTHAQPKEGLSTAYLKALRQQAEVTRAATPQAKFAQIAVGGGTPTYLNNDEIVDLFDIMTNVMGADPGSVPVSFEASPATVDESKLKLLKGLGVNRLSVGVQSFNHREAHAIGRPEKPEMVRRALDQLVKANFDTLNIDLIYGGQGQSTEQWLESVQSAIDYQPEEIFLYPLYVRQLTGLDRVSSIKDFTDDENTAWDKQRLVAYREARELLIANGYAQKSLRMFQSKRLASLEEPDSVYRCQEDGMIGLGCGARSYTSSVHYSSEYAVSSKAVLGLIKEFIGRDRQQFSIVDYGYKLDDEDQRRRFALLSLLNVEGIDRREYERQFRCDPYSQDVIGELPELMELVVHGLAKIDKERVRLTELGIECSDAIGPWFYSTKVQELMEEFVCQ